MNRHEPNRTEPEVAPQRATVYRRPMRATTLCRLAASSRVVAAWKRASTSTKNLLVATPSVARGVVGKVCGASVKCATTRTMSSVGRRRTPSVATTATRATRDLDGDDGGGTGFVPVVPTMCPGCGVGLQGEDKNAPGFFVMPKRAFAQPSDEDDEDEEEEEDDDAFIAGVMDDEDDDDIDEDFIPDGFELDENYVEADDAQARLDALNALFDDDEDDYASARRAEKKKRKKKGPPAVVCARCFALRTSGKVKNEAAEVLLPSFDFERVIGDSFERLKTPGSAVVLLMVDLLDFDGSFPVDAIDVIEPYVESGVVDVLLVANKVDLMPVQCTRTRLTSFVRRRSKAFGLSRCSGVHLVSAKAGMGVNILATQLEQLLDRGKEVYVVGAQNAGKSSLINRLSQRYGGPGEEDGGPIASPLPGTTLGMVKLPSLLPNGSDVYDTPGLLQPFQLSSRLTGEEMKLVLPSRRLTPRTYRAEIGSTIHIGGLARIDVIDSPQRTVYLTVWASNKVNTHYSRTGKDADAFLEKHGGSKMTPPIGELRMQNFGKWGYRTLNVYGEEWQASTRDISIAGLGWIAVGCNGNASFRVWTHEGVQVVTREALIPDMDKRLMSPGFSFENVGGGSSKNRPNDRANRQRGGGERGRGRGGRN